MLGHVYGQAAGAFGGGLKCDDPYKNQFDIHGGGIDLVFPHHENELAQSCCAFGTERMANIWMHNGFLQVEGQKMSKSLGNFITIRDVLNDGLPQLGVWDDKDARDRWVGLAARLSMLQTHYREPINWTAQRLAESAEELHRWYGLLRDADFAAPSALSVVEEVADALSDDLNTVCYHGSTQSIQGQGRCSFGRGHGAIRLARPLLCDSTGCAGICKGRC